VNEIWRAQLAFSQTRLVARLLMLFLRCMCVLIMAGDTLVTMALVPPEQPTRLIVRADKIFFIHQYMFSLRFPRTT
jgi:hypothetical protein